MCGDIIDSFYRRNRHIIHIAAEIWNSLQIVLWWRHKMEIITALLDLSGENHWSLGDYPHSLRKDAEHFSLFFDVSPYSCRWLFYAITKACDFIDFMELHRLHTRSNQITFCISYINFTFYKRKNNRTCISVDRFHSGTFDIISATFWRTEAGVWTPAAHWLNSDQQGHIGRSIWPLTPVRPLECKRLLQNIANTCDLKTSAHKQLGRN